jgi:hypothetical protein
MSSFRKKPRRFSRWFRWAVSFPKGCGESLAGVRSTASLTTTSRTLTGFEDCAWDAAAAPASWCRKVIEQRIAVHDFRCVVVADFGSMMMS